MGNIHALPGPWIDISSLLWQCAKLTRSWEQCDPPNEVVSVLLFSLHDKVIVVTPVPKCTARSGLNFENLLCFSNMPQLTLIGFWFHFSPGDRAAYKKSNIYAEEFRSEAFREWNMYVGQWKGNCSSSQDSWIILVYPLIAMNLSYAPPTLTHTVFAVIMIEKPRKFFLPEKLTNMICVSKHCLIA